MAGPRAIALALSLGLLAAACSKRASPGASADGAAPTSASLPASASVTRWPGVTLARSTASAPLPAGIETVAVGATAMVLEGGGEIALLPPAADGMHGFDARYKRGSRIDYYVLPLATALVPDGGPAPHADVAFAFDADTAYRLVAEVLYTAGQARAARVHLAVDHDGAVAEITGAVPRPVRPQPMLTVAVVDAGYIVSTPGGRVGAECGSTDAGATAAPAGAGATVPKRFGGFDAAALTACVSRLARQDATVAGKHELTITAEPGAPFGDVVRALDAMRAAPDGTPLFTEVHFGIPL